MTMGDRIHPTRLHGATPETATALAVEQVDATAPASSSGGTALHGEVAGSDEGSRGPSNEPGR
jgi:hypothetical protein